MNANEVADRIEAFVRRQFAVSPDDARFSRTVDLFEMGYVDSIGFAELLDFAQQAFGVEIPEGDLLSDAFSTIDGMADIITGL